MCSYLFCKKTFKFLVDSSQILRIIFLTHLPHCPASAVSASKMTLKSILQKHGAEVTCKCGIFSITLGRQAVWR